jgi:GT2 family glycosyltransferase
MNRNTHSEIEPEKIPEVVVSILVVSYNTRELTLDCLRSVVKESPSLFFEVLLLDNQSSDGSFEAIEQEFGHDSRFRLISSRENLGFAGGNNKLATMATGEFLLLLNPDTVVLDKAIEKLVDFSRATPAHLIWGGRTVYPDGSLNSSNCWGDHSLWMLLSSALGLSHMFPNSAVFSPRSYPKWDRKGVREVGVVTGCFLLLSRASWEALGGFNPEFMMYGEEIDLCLRARSELGAKPICTGAAEIIHYGGASDPYSADKVIRLLLADLRLFYRHWSGLKFQLARMLLLLRISVRVIASGLRGDPQSVWKEVWKRRREWSRSPGILSPGVHGSSPAETSP